MIWFSSSFYIINVIYTGHNIILVLVFHLDLWEVRGRHHQWSTSSWWLCTHTYIEREREREREREGGRLNLKHIITLCMCLKKSYIGSL